MRRHLFNFLTSGFRFGYLLWRLIQADDHLTSIWDSIATPVIIGFNQREIEYVVAAVLLTKIASAAIVPLALPSLLGAEIQIVCHLDRLTFINPLVAMGPMFYILYHRLYNLWSIYQFERKRV